MASVSKDAGTAASDMAGLTDSAATFERLQTLMRAKDDTSRFVGLALLKTVLDNGLLAQQSDSVRALWASLPPKFLDRLLRAQRSKKTSASEATDMVDLAVTILHTFAILLPEDSRKDKRLTGRTSPLVNALLQSSPETTKLILETLLTIASEPEGALEMLQVEEKSPLIEIASTNALVLEILKFTWVGASIVPTHTNIVRENIDMILPKLLDVFRDTDAVTFITFMSDLFPRLALEALPSSPTWLKLLVSLLRKLVFIKPTAAGRSAYTRLAAVLLQAYPRSCPVLLFEDDAPGGPDKKPFSYLFINLLLIDIRSSFPSLLIRLNSSDYPAISQRLAAAFDIISGFIGYLVQSLDNEDRISSFNMPPDLLLRLRKDIAETMSLAIEYFRDRWDASVAGTAGLHHSARSETTSTSEGTRRTLTWESMKDNVNSDPLILAGIRSLAIWIREDENENLRNETAGLMDMLVELYKAGSVDTLDFRFPIILALEGILVTEEGMEAFLGQDGWQIIYQDLKSIITKVFDGEAFDCAPILAESGRGLQILRVLVTVVDHESTSFPQEDWMEAIKTAASMKVPISTPPPIVLELQVGMLQLASALMSKASGGMAKRFFTSNTALFGLAAQLKALAKKSGGDAEYGDLLPLLDDVVLDLENLRHGE